jgi:hypothetical protein
VKGFYYLPNSESTSSEGILMADDDRGFVDRTESATEKLSGGPMSIDEMGGLHETLPKTKRGGLR